MSAPLVSIVLPVRNAGGTLAAAVESCLGQSFGDLELVIVPNGCTDSSEDTARGFGERDDRVRVVPAPTEGGVAAAMEVGLAAGRSPFVARMDADDVAHPERITRQLELLKVEPGLSLVSTDVRLVESQGEGMERYVAWVNGLTTPEDVARERFIECPVIQPSILFRREILPEVPYRAGLVGWAEDHDFFLRLLEAGHRFGKVPATLLEWRDSASRLTRTHAAYSEAQVWRMKAHYLSRLPVIRERGVAICGAGPIGKRLARLLGEEGTRVHGFFEVNPRRIGERIHGAEVAGLDAFGSRWREAVLLSAVGIDGGRARVRALAASADYREGEDFWCCC